jgi:type I restriction enzyme M protein
MNQDLKKTLWAAADKLRCSMDAAEYKHIVLGLIFLKYISDAFDERTAAFADEANDLYLPDAEDRVLAADERDYYTMVNCFWVPGPARETVRARMRVMVKMLLKRYKYPPDRQKSAAELPLR